MKKQNQWSTQNMKIFDVNNKNFERLTFQEINFEFRSSNHWRRLNLNYIFLCVRSRVYNEIRTEKWCQFVKELKIKI